MYSEKWSMHKHPQPGFYCIFVKCEIRVVVVRTMPSSTLPAPTSTKNPGTSSEQAKNSSPPIIVPYSSCKLLSFPMHCRCFSSILQLLLYLLLTDSNPPPNEVSLYLKLNSYHYPLVENS